MLTQSGKVQWRRESSASDFTIAERGARCCAKLRRSAGKQIVVQSGTEERTVRFLRTKSTEVGNRTLPHHVREGHELAQPSRFDSHVEWRVSSHLGHRRRCGVPCPLYASDAGVPAPATACQARNHRHSLAELRLPPRSKPRASDRKVRSGFRINPMLKQRDRAAKRFQLSVRRSSQLGALKGPSSSPFGPSFEEVVRKALTLHGYSRLGA